MTIREDNFGEASIAVTNSALLIPKMHLILIDLPSRTFRTNERSLKLDLTLGNLRRSNRKRVAGTRLLVERCPYMLRRISVRFYTAVHEINLFSGAKMMHYQERLVK